MVSLCSVSVFLNRIVLLLFALLLTYKMLNMSKKNFFKNFRKSIYVLASIFLFGSCQTDKLDVNEKSEELSKLGVPEFAESYLKSIDPLTPQEYESNLRMYRPDVSLSTMRSVAMPATFELPAMPVGNQGKEGSCVGWGIGYAAHSMTRYINNPVHNRNWRSASRSAAFVYNQIKISDCIKGSYPDDAMNLLKQKGECGADQMPYVEGGCFTMPSAKQLEYARERKISSWKNISATSVEDIKYYLSKNYPVPACFDYNESFQAISRNNYVWNSVYGKRNGGHCVCIVGYNDVTKQFKVQNSWGRSWGRQGYFYVTYDAIKQGAFKWAAIMFPEVKTEKLQSLE
ncbi:peptidase C1A papain [Flavobacterium columnare]|uniref:Peptidase C1A papain n=2 Tax=Flavobacterium columnare TaxID=996 RepID=G8X745_FLACA|nr:peptidase C1A papain [Flavobacterium columnare ATCC 49512]AUX19099.1 peptidase C1A papain [Flavobacterium columnare]PDS25889.1 peptidase C1A papain [Flavobacterium columnare] [Flavobacterium columnare NBRC 100251 = ATCC 23463]